MTVWALLRKLLRHVLRGRGRDEVFLCVYATPRRDGIREAVTAEDVTFTWERGPDRFCTLFGRQVPSPAADQPRPGATHSRDCYCYRGVRPPFHPAGTPRGVTMYLETANPVLIPDRNVFEIAAGRVQPGHVLLNGLVLAVDGLDFHFGHATVETADSPEQPVTVLGRVTEAVLEAARQAHLDRT